MKVFSESFFPKSFIVLPFTFKSIVHLELILCMVWVRGQDSFLFHMVTQLTQHHILKDHLSLAIIFFNFHAADSCWICGQPDSTSAFQMDCIKPGLFHPGYIAQVLIFVFVFFLYLNRKLDVYSWWMSSYSFQSIISTNQKIYKIPCPIQYICYVHQV